MTEILINIDNQKLHQYELNIHVEKVYVPL